MAIRELFVTSGGKYLFLLIQKPPFHGGNRGSNPRGDAIKKIIELPRYPLLPGVSGDSVASRPILRRPLKSRFFTNRFVTNSWILKSRLAGVR